MQRHVLLKTFVILAALACLGGCGASDDGLPNDPTDAVMTDSVGDTASADVAPRPPGFELGSNPQGRNDPTSFVPLGDGGDLEIVLGPQGLWMVVLAFRTRGLLEGRLLLESTILVGDTQQGRLVLQEQPTFAGPEGWFYYYNFFLVVDDPTVSGETATIAFKATDGSGRVVERTLSANLTGGL